MTHGLDPVDATASALERVVGAFPPARCLVTGGAGFIGSNLVRALLRAGCQVTVLDDFSTGKRDRLPPSERLAVVEGDVATQPSLEDLAANADYVFHLAAQVGNLLSIQKTERDAAVNIQGSVRLLCACRGTAVRKLVYSSSSATFGEALRLPIDERHPQAPASPYALSKMTAEWYMTLAATLWGAPAVSLRYFNVYGLPVEPSEYAGVIPIFCERLQTGEPLVIYGDGRQCRDFVHVEDVVQANLLAALHGRAGGVYNIGSGEVTTISGLAATLAEVSGKRANVVLRPARAGEVRSSVADITLARTELGYSPAWLLKRGLASIWRELSA